MDNAAEKNTESGIDTDPHSERATVGGSRPERESYSEDGRLEAIVVRYRSGPDRCTLVPRYATPEATLTAWLTTDLETVVDLEDAR